MHRNTPQPNWLGIASAVLVGTVLAIAVSAFAFKLYLESYIPTPPPTKVHK